jgi:hypothetical protein
MTIYDIKLMPRYDKPPSQKELKERKRVRSEHARRSRLEKLRNDPEARGRNDHLKMTEEQKRRRGEDNRRQKEEEYKRRHKSLIRRMELHDRLENLGYLLLRR